MFVGAKKTMNISSFTTEPSVNIRMYRTITKCNFRQVFNRNLCTRVPFKRILNTLKNLPNYNQHLNGISFYFIIVTLRYIYLIYCYVTCRKE